MNNERLKETFLVMKNIIIAQNEIFLRDLAKRFKKDPDLFVKRYIRPDLYLPVVKWNNKSTSDH